MNRLEVAHPFSEGVMAGGATDQGKGQFGNDEKEGDGDEPESHYPVTTIMRPQ